MAAVTISSPNSRTTHTAPYKSLTLLNEISYELDVLEGKLRHIKIDKVLDAIGFPKNYKNLLRMDY